MTVAFPATALFHDQHVGVGLRENRLDGRPTAKLREGRGPARQRKRLPQKVFADELAERNIAEKLLDHRDGASVAIEDAFVMV
ncbi:MAG TPA: hypothetical protein PK867_12445 [Pirellulales bacterium]|nr:hypothetical protein [Pirellulales bacterium]